jgi:hypothetical protein
MVAVVRKTRVKATAPDSRLTECSGRHASVDDLETVDADDDERASDDRDAGR